MVSSYLQGLIEEPIKDAKRANGIWLPEGRRPVRQPRRVLTDEERAERKASREYRERMKDEHFRQLAEYYAKTDVPIERVKSHLGFEDVEDARKVMRSLGRTDV